MARTCVVLQTFVTGQVGKKFVDKDEVTRLLLSQRKKTLGVCAFWHIIHSAYQSFIMKRRHGNDKKFPTVGAADPYKIASDVSWLFCYPQHPNDHVKKREIGRKEADETLIRPSNEWWSTSFN